MGVVDRLHIRSTIKVLLAIAAQDLGTEVVGVDSGKVRCSLAEMGAV